MKIDITSEIERFKEHLTQTDNNKIIFSGIFGIGKTYFLKEFFLNNSEKYELFLLSPVNYSISNNDDIINYINYDIAFNLISKSVYYEKNDLPKLLTAQFYLKDNLLDTMSLLAKNCGSIGKTLSDLYENGKELIENINQHNAKSQIDEEQDDKENNLDDWKFDARLSKEFESLGFFISDHPLNEYSEILENYEISSFAKFSNDIDKLDSNIASTVLKIQEKKTQKGNSYAIVKFSDRQSVFELFIFSDLLETNREFLKEGNSLILNVSKNLQDENNRFKKFNVKKISPLKSLVNKPIKNVVISIEGEDSLKKINKILFKPGETTVKIKIISNSKGLVFNLKNKRYFDRSHINLLKNQGINTNIS